MRPIFLKMSAFGPYSDVTEIDFDRLGKNGIYLITGETGAGKTIIFDAITFALFGTPSGDNRVVDSLRSKYAKSTTKTYVELTFEYKGEIYKVSRVPNQRYEKTPGKEIEVKTDATLEKPNNEVVSGATSVKKEIESILGIDREQFKQIAMISQGDFQELLLSKTDKRIEILKKIFHTEKFKELEEELKKEESLLNKEYEKSINNINLYIDNIITDKGSAFDFELDKIKKNEIDLNKVPEIISEIIENNEKEYRKLDSEIEKQKEEYQNLLSKIQKLEDQEKAKNNLEDIKNGIDEYTRSIDGANEAYKKALDEEPKKNDLIKVLNKLELYLPRYTDLSNDEIEWEKVNKKIEDLNKSIENNERTIESLKNEIEENEKEINAIGNIENERLKKETEKNNLEREEKEIEYLYGFIQDLKKYKDKIVKKEIELKDAIREKTEKSKEYDNKQNIYLMNQAGILAEGLLDNMPCPVCGSYSHPCLAKKDVKAPSKDELDVLKKLLDDKGKVLEGISKETNELNVLIGEKENNIKEKANSLLGEIDLNKLPNLVTDKKVENESKRKTLNDEIYNLKEKETRKISLEKKAKEDKEEKISLENSNTKNRIELGEEKVKSKTLKERIDKTNIELDNKTLNEVEKEIEDLKKQIKEINDNIEIKRKETENIKLKIRELEGQKKTLKESLKESITGDIDKERETKVKIEEKIVETEKEIKEQNHILKTNKENLKKIESELSRNKDLFERWKWIKALSDTAKGNNGNRIQFETYILTSYFDRIIDRANLRLIKMTNGQYEFVRRKDITNKRSQAGLDLNVIDHYDLCEREVSSLSGGESFMAALSLALGLSDEVQSNAGGIEIGTMFIDEGFGSLDEKKSLQQAIRALMDLAEYGPLVGIISHVESLMEKIDRQIIVTKNETGGSVVEVI